MSSLDFSQKKLIKTFYYTNVDNVLNAREEINGCYDINKTVTPIALVCLLYYVYDRSVKSFKYVLHVGATTVDTYVDVDEEFEQAYINALINPQLTLTSEKNCFDRKLMLSVKEMFENGR